MEWNQVSRTHGWLFGLACTAAVSASSVASAQTLQQLRNGIEIAYKSLDGKEVDLDGVIGTFLLDEFIVYADATGRYEVTFDAGREARRSIEGCTINMFNPMSSPCRVTGKAELSVELDDNLGDGFEIKLIVFELARAGR